MQIRNLDFMGLSKYAVREDGVIINTVKISVVKQHPNRQGYLRVSLRQDCGKPKKFSVHRLVAFAFLDNPEGKDDVNHKDFNVCNNHYSNLEWVTPKENYAHSDKAGRCKLPNPRVVTKAQMSLIMNLSMPIKQVKELTGLSSSLISYHRRK